MRFLFTEWCLCQGEKLASETLYVYTEPANRLYLREDIPCNYILLTIHNTMFLIALVSSQGLQRKRRRSLKS
jgi:hypothetical protein